MAKAKKISKYRRKYGESVLMAKIMKIMKSL